MKLSELKPCACCKGPLVGRPMMGTWYVLRISQAMLSPRSANETLGLMQYFQGSLAMAEVFSPSTGKEVMIFGDENKVLQTELHVCFDCFHFKLGRLGELLEQAGKEKEETCDQVPE